MTTDKCAPAESMAPGLLRQIIVPDDKEIFCLFCRSMHVAEADPSAYYCAGQPEEWVCKACGRDFAVLTLRAILYDDRDAAGRGRG